MEGVTSVVWLKGYSKLSGYDNETRNVEGKDNNIISILYITVSHETLGAYTCYCYYNNSMVKSRKTVTSNQATITLRTNCPAKNSTSEGRLACSCDINVCS